MATVRAFIALELSSELRERLAAIQHDLRRLDPQAARLSFPRVDGIHLTLAFLGDIDEALVADLHVTLGAALDGCQPFMIELRGCGAFPDFGRPRVLWAGVARNEALSDLAARVRAGLRTCGLALDDKPFKPHLTLARVKTSQPGILGACLKPHLSESFGRMRVARVLLFQSTLDPGGAIYSPLAMWTLGN
jgi:2'-5' RNA ligase